MAFYMIQRGRFDEVSCRTAYTECGEWRERNILLNFHALIPMHNYCNAWNKKPYNQFCTNKEQPKCIQSR